MQFHLFRLRFNRRLHKGQRQVEGLGQQAEAGLERHFFRRLTSLNKVWRFVTSWILLFLIIIGALIAQLAGLGNHYQTIEPVPGGTYNEGVLGTFTNANPLFATSPVDTTVSRLVFSGLFMYNIQNQLVGDLASSYTVNDIGTVYTVHLKPNLTWQDGKPLTADDVVFTYQEIQNPDVQSPLLGSWQGIQVAKVNTYTISFTLPNPLSSFPYQLTNGIVPEHLLASTPATDLRSADFNTVDPVGSGPFAWDALQVEDPNPDTAQVLVALKPFANYHFGAPKLAGFVVKAFADPDQLTAAFQKNELNGVAGLTDVPASLSKDSSLVQYNLELTAATMAFFNTTNPILSDTNVRRALVQGTNTIAILKKLGYPTSAVREPLLDGQLGYDPSEVQASYNVVAAKSALTSDGWVPGANGIRTKGGLPLSFSLYGGNSDEDNLVTSMLAAYWHNLGAQVDVHLQSNTDLQTTIGAHSYGALLYGISIGTDPDVFVYWDSSQIDPRSTRLNFSLYSNPTADAALEGGRTRLDPALRVIKYKPFLQAWQQDAPAIALYQPRFLYLTNEKVYGLDEKMVNTGTDRFNNVQNWMIRTAKVTND